MHPKRHRDISECLSRAEELERGGETTKAIEAYSEAIRQHPSSDIPFYLRGWLYFTIGELNLAILDHSAAIRLCPDNGEYYASRALIHYVMNDDESAIRDSTLAIRHSEGALARDLARVHYCRGMAYRRNGDPRAESDFSIAREFDPDGSYDPRR